MTAFRPGQSPPPVRTPTRILFLPGVQTVGRPDATLVPMSVLAIDAGTTGVTALIVAADGAVAGRGYAEFSQYFPQPGWAEQMPEEIWQATLTTCAQALRPAADRSDPVTCIGITNQRETAVVWDSATLSAPHRAIVWQDRRTARICAELREAGHEDRVAELTRLRIAPYLTPTQPTAPPPPPP